MNLIHWCKCEIIKSISNVPNSVSLTPKRSRLGFLQILHLGQVTLVDKWFKYIYIYIYIYMNMSIPKLAIYSHWTLTGD